MRNATRSLAVFFALAPALIAAPVAANTGLEAYLDRIDAAETDFRAACEALAAETPPEGLVWLRVGPNGIEIAPADASGAEAAAFWADAALGARAAAERLYGAAVDEALADAPVMIEARAGSVTVHDGAEMSMGDPCEALKRLVSALGGASSSAPFAAARASAEASDAIAVAVGGEAEAPLSALPAGAVARGPAGVEAEIVENEDGARLVLTAGPDARPGRGLARIYAPGDKFRPLETMPVTVLPGAAPPSEPSGGALPLGGAFAGAVRVGAQDVLTVTVDEARRVEFASSGDADISAVLESETGQVIAADDDSGDGYGFAFSVALSPGRYALKLRHCCGGGGGYAVTATPE
ncbi:MAG: hypothetical protein AAFN79_00670 [Pseudomonadota bacterium]